MQWKDDIMQDKYHILTQPFPRRINMLTERRSFIVLVSAATLATYLSILSISSLRWNASFKRVHTPNHTSVLKQHSDASSTKAWFGGNYSRLVKQSTPLVTATDITTSKPRRIPMLTTSKNDEEFTNKAFRESLSGKSYGNVKANQNSFSDSGNSAILLDASTVALDHLSNRLEEIVGRLRLHEQVKDISTTYLSIMFNGRLGNQMFEFASLLGIARLHGVTPAIPRDSELARVFNLNIPEIDLELVSNFSFIGQRRDCAFDPIEGNFTRNQTLSGYFQSWRYFSDVFPELRKHFTFKDIVTQRAKSVMEHFTQTQHGSLSLWNTTLVGVHVRRGDLLTTKNVEYGYNIGTKEYLYQAIDYFISKYESVRFIVCSDDIQWCRETIPFEIATFISNQKAEVDMAILSLCNHTIMTVGSYGWWSGWLAGGTTVYQVQQVIPGTELDKRFNLTDYMLPDWLGMNQEILVVTQ